MNSRFFAWLAVLVFGLAASWTGAQEPQRGAKELFYDPDGRDVTNVTLRGTEGKEAARGQSPTARPATAPPRIDPSGRRLVALPAASETQSTPGVLGISYWIELESPGSGAGVQVTARRIFTSGERIRLHFRSNAPGHISILQLGASGTAQVLFPDVAQGLADTAMSPNSERILPSAQHWFRFDANPGQERLIVVFARSRSELDELPMRQRMDQPATQGFLQRTVHLRGSKDLFIETEAQNAAEVGTYGVNLAGQPVVLEIVLEHR